MLNHTSNGHTIFLPEDTIQKMGHKLVMINPDSINRLFAIMTSFYPVKMENLPKIPELIHIQSDTLPECYGVTSDNAFEKFIQNLNDSVDLITKNDFLRRNAINSYRFTLS